MLIPDVFPSKMTMSNGGKGTVTRLWCDSGQWKCEVTSDDGVIVETKALYIPSDQADEPLIVGG